MICERKNFGKEKFLILPIKKKYTNQIIIMKIVKLVCSFFFQKEKLFKNTTFLF
jgi:hypothetical protein